MTRVTCDLFHVKTIWENFIATLKWFNGIFERNGKSKIWFVFYLANETSSNINFCIFRNFTDVGPTKVKEVDIWGFLFHAKLLGLKSTSMCYFQQLLSIDRLQENSQWWESSHVGVAKPFQWHAQLKFNSY